MSDFFAIPTTSVVISNIGSWTNGFFLPFLGPVLALAGIFIAAVLSKKIANLISKGVTKVTSGNRRRSRNRR